MDRPSRALSRPLAIARSARAAGLACALALALFATVALAQAGVESYSGIYEHVWLAQGMVGGDLGGEIVTRVSASEVELQDASGEWSGRMSYEDRIGVESPSGDVAAQLSTIVLDLTGESVSAGESAGGTFEGSVHLRVYDADAPRDAFSDDRLGPLETDVEYHVTGHWGAVITEDGIVGEILYETATASDVHVGAATATAADFNRPSLENPDALGEAQVFRVASGGPAGGSGDGGGDGDGGSGDGASGGGATGGSAAGDTDTDTDTDTFWDFVAKGFAGADAEEMPVPLELGARARILLDATPVGAMSLPTGALAIDVDVAGAYLDAKNRAAGLLDDGPTDALPDVTPEWEAARELTAQAVAPGDADRLTYYGERLLDSLDEAESVLALAGADDLRADIEAVLAAGTPPSGEDPAPLVKVWSHVAQALVREAASAWVADDTHDVAATVLATPVAQSGPLADAVLVWADRDAAPAVALEMDRFSREPSLDATPAVEGDALLARTLARYGGGAEPPALAVREWAGVGTRRFAPEAWVAFVSPTGRVLWRAEEDGEIALTDGTLDGWAFVSERMWAIDARRIGRIRAVYEVE